MTRDQLDCIRVDAQAARNQIAAVATPLSEAIEDPFSTGACSEIMIAFEALKEASNEVESAIGQLAALAKRVQERPLIIAGSDDIPATCAA